MDQAGGQSRRKRHPLTPEEVSDIIAYKKRKEHERLVRFRRSRRYRVLNILNVLCFFIYIELGFCFFGPCVYEEHVVSSATAHYGEDYDATGRAFVSDMDLKEGDATYRLMVRDFIDLPEPGARFSVGKDFLLGKEMKAVLADGGHHYRLFSASPLIILCGLALSISVVAIMYNLNQNSYSLMAMSVLNGMVLVGILLLR